MNIQIKLEDSMHTGENFFNAFTLVESLVVIAILGILAALLLPALSQSKRRAQQITCVSNLHQLGVGLQNFVDNNHVYPFQHAWDEQLTRDGLGISTRNGQFLTNGVWLCPSVQWGRWANKLKQSYCYNGFGVFLTSRSGVPDDGGSLGAWGLLNQYVPVLDQYVPVAESAVAVPSDMIAIGDSFIGSPIFVRKNVAFLETCGNAASRHADKGNVVFCDGHVESPTLKYLFEDTSDEALSRWNRDHRPHSWK